MALSDFALRNDVFVYQAETGVRGLFQGIGIGSTWQLHLPRRSNDFDLNRIFDIHLVLYYTAAFDAPLRELVLARPPRDGELARVKDFALRYDFPDAWFAFYRSGAAQFSLDRVRLPLNQTSFKTLSTVLRVVTKPGVSSEGIEVRITTPSGASGTATTDAQGAVSSDDAALAALEGGDPVGSWEIDVVGGASLANGGGLAFERISNIQLGLEYGFEYVDEVV
jgi:hypothetical protein